MCCSGQDEKIIECCRFGSWCFRLRGFRVYRIDMTLFQPSVLLYFSWQLPSPVRLAQLLAQLFRANIHQWHYSACIPTSNTRQKFPLCFVETHHYPSFFILCCLLSFCILPLFLVLVHLDFILYHLFLVFHFLSFSCRLSVFVLSHFTRHPSRDFLSGSGGKDSSSSSTCTSSCV